MSRAVSRLAWCGLTYGCIGLGAAGMVLPLLPTTPFLLLAAWSAPKGSPRLAHWLHTHPRFGPMLLAWHEHRAIPRRAKALAALLLTVSWMMLWAGGVPLPGLIASGLLFVTVAGFVLSRPGDAPPLPDETLRSQVRR
ncbi:MAG TPA: YbaN family protein [Halomonas sp.]|nr:YbaN family protein [Halomonas sp.]